MPGAVGDAHLAPDEQPASALVLGRLRAEQLRVGCQVPLQISFGGVGLLDHLDEPTVAQDEDRAHRAVLRAPQTSAMPPGGLEPPTLRLKGACSSH